MKRYLAFMKAGIIEGLQFRLSFCVMIFGNLIYLTIIYFLWKSIFNSANTDVVNGMTFSDTLIYLVLATAIFNFMEMYVVWEMGRNIQSGKIVLDLLKPMDYKWYLFWSFSGKVVTQFFTTFIPTFIIVAVVTKNGIPLGINLLYFFISVIMAIFINFCIDFFVGTICLFTESIWGINIFKQVVVFLFSGATIPIAFFPEPLKTMVMYMPFQAIYNSPLIILLNKQVNTRELIDILGSQFFWCIISYVVCILFWKKSIKQITVNGG